MKKIGLSLSGGGYRAAVFHLGTLKKLNDLSILDKVDVLSTISGGSITGAAWCLSTKDYPSFHEEMLSKLKSKSIIKYILTSRPFIIAAIFVLVFFVSYFWVIFTSWSPFAFFIFFLFIFSLLIWQFKIFPVSRVVEEAYNCFFFNNRTLDDLKDQPLLAIGSSNLHTGRPFTFSKKKMSDSSYVFRSEYDPPIEFLQSKFPVARAVAASSCVPFVFTPVTIGKEFFKMALDYDRINPQLIDGGVYDNQGIQKITQNKSSYECSTIIVSDAGGNFLANKNYTNTIALLIRTVDLFMNRIKTSQMVQNIYRNIDGRAKPIAYFSLGWKLENCIPGFINNMILGQVLDEVIAAHNLNKEWIKNPNVFRASIQEHLVKRLSYAEIEKRNLSEEEWNLARVVGTNLKPLPRKVAEYLIRHAENLTELQVKLYCPSLIEG
jgi:NTE family protein